MEHNATEMKTQVQTYLKEHLILTAKREIEDLEYEAQRKFGV